jgi:hypothetical protein
MDVISRQAHDVETIKSVSLADLQFGAPSRFDRIIEVARTALVLWGALTFGAVAGTAVYYFAGATAEPARAPQEIVADAVAVEPEALEPAVAETAPIATVALAEVPPHLADYIAPTNEERLAQAPAPMPTARPEPPTIAEARLPRARPDEPVITGSIARAPASEAPRTQQHGRVDPCRVLRDLGARFVLKARCGREARADAPPLQLHQPHVVQ